MTASDAFGSFIMILILAIVLIYAVLRRKAKEEEELMRRKKERELPYLTETDKQDFLKEVLRTGKPMTMTVDENGKKVMKVLE
jgi:hypothetical protein